MSINYCATARLQKFSGFPKLLQLPHSLQPSRATQFRVVTPHRKLASSRLAARITGDSSYARDEQVANNLKGGPDLQQWPPFARCRGSRQSAEVAAFCLAGRTGQDRPKARPPPCHHILCIRWVLDPHLHRLWLRLLCDITHVPI